MINNKHIKRDFRIIRYKRYIRCYQGEMVGGFMVGLMGGLIYFFRLYDLIIWK